MTAREPARAARAVLFYRRRISMAAVRDFDPTQINSDFSAILEQAGISFTYQGNSITGVWSSSRDAFSEFEDQRRADSKFTVFLLTSSVSATPQVTQTLSRAGITYFIERVTLDAEGAGCEIEVCKSI
jgi:hypothetical protein